MWSYFVNIWCMSLHLAIQLIPWQNLAIAMLGLSWCLNIKFRIKYKTQNMLLPVDVFLKQDYKLVLNVLHSPPVHQVQHIRAEENSQG